MKLTIRWNKTYRTWDVRTPHQGYLIAADPTWAGALAKANTYLQVHA